MSRLALKSSPQRHWVPRKPRQIALIKLAVRQTIRQLVTGEAPWPLFLRGAVGTGKTCAALCLLDHASGFYYTALGLCEAMIQAQQGRLTMPTNGHRLWPEGLWLELGQSALVVLDELGAREKVSDFHYETVKRLIDEREGQPLVCLSNLDADALAQLYDARLASRLVSGTVLTIEGEDQRLRQPPTKGATP